MSRVPGELTFDELCIMLQRIFKNRIAHFNNHILRYLDEGIHFKQLLIKV
jgi:hypothetical protein